MKRARWFRGILVVLALSIGGLVVVGLLWGDRLSLEALGNIRPAYLVLASTMVGGMWLTEALRVRTILGILGEEVSLGRVLVVNLATLFWAAVTPAASGGPPAQIYFLSKAGVQPVKAVAAVAGRLLLTSLFFVITVPLTFIIFQHALGLPRSLAVLIYLASACLLGAVALLLYLLLRTRVIYRLVIAVDRLPVVGRIARKANWAEGLAKLRSALNVLISAPRTKAILAFGYTLAYEVLFFGLAPVILSGLGLVVPVADVVVRQLVVYFLSSYVPLPGASGVAELGMGGLFSGLVPREALLPFVGGWRLFTYYINIVVGLLVFIRFMRTPVLS